MERMPLPSWKLIPGPLLIWACSFLPLSADVLHVDQSASGLDDGSSWTDAFHHLQDALADAESGDEVWVAVGAYKPDQGAPKHPATRPLRFHSWTTWRSTAASRPEEVMAHSRSGILILPPMAPSSPAISRGMTSTPTATRSPSQLTTSRETTTPTTLSPAPGPAPPLFSMASSSPPEDYPQSEPA